MTPSEHCHSLIADLPTPGSQTSAHGIDRRLASLIRAQLQRMTTKRNWIVKTKLVGSEFVVWRVC